MMNRKKAERIVRKQKQARKAIKGKIVTKAQAKETKAAAAKVPPEIEDPVIKFKVSEDRELEKQRTKDRDRAQDIYQRWKHDFINRRKTPEQIVVAINDLIDQLDQGIEGDDWKGWLIANILNPIMNRAHQGIILQKFSVSAFIKCGAPIVKNGSAAECKWGGLARFHQHDWDRGDCKFTCPECSAPLNQTDNMMLESKAKELFAEHQKEQGKK